MKSVVASPHTLITEAYGVLNRARREMRSEDHLTARERQRILDLATMAQFPALLRDAAWERRRGRRVSPYRYRGILS